jgi:uncharacterized repeat protein (TIGR03809 family)
MPPAPPPLDTVAFKWRDLAERRLRYYVELYRSGRYRHYYTEQTLALRMLDVIKAVRMWTALAPQRPAAKIDQVDRDDLRPAA